MNRGVLLFFVMVAAMSLRAQNQRGIVRAIRSDGSGTEPLENVIVRPQGGNDVKSGADGCFLMELSGGLREGDSFQLVKVYRRGYEPVDKQLLSRWFVYSKSVPVEIILVSSRQLAKVRMRIENDARRRFNKRYDRSVANLRKQLDSCRISAEKYRTELDSLERAMSVFENLIGAMADHYARTRYDRRDSLNIKINRYIEEGRLEQADSLINTKGDVVQRAHDNIAKGRRLRASENFVDSIRKMLRADTVAGD